MKTSILCNKIIGSLLAIVACSFWGSTYPGVKLAYDALGINVGHIPSIFLLAGIQFTIMGIFVVSGYSIWAKKFEPPRGKTLKTILTIMLFSTVLHYAFTYVGIANTTGAKSAIIKQIGFLVLPAIAFVFRKEDKFSIYKVLGGILGFVSVILMNFNGLEFSFSFGDVCILAASTCAIISTVVSKNAYDTLNPVYIMGYCEIFGGIIFLIGGFLAGGRIGRITPGGIGIVAYCSFASVTAYLLWNNLLKHNNMSKLSVLKFFEPLSAVLFSGILLNERVWNLKYAVSLILILLGICITNVKLPELKLKNTIAKGVH